MGNLVGEYGEGTSGSHLVMKDKGKKVCLYCVFFLIYSSDEISQRITITANVVTFNYVRKKS